eukprot:superscaffoldBa00002546_g14608
MTGGFLSVSIMRPNPCWTILHVSILAGLLLTLNVESNIEPRIVTGKNETRKPKKETSTENQYMAMPMVEQAFPQASLQPSSREGPSVPPTRRSTRKKMPPSQRNESTLPEDHLYGVIKEDDERQRNVAEEEGSSVVYAALNHQRAPAAAARPRIQIEESSEYAAIRVP